MIGAGNSPSATMLQAVTAYESGRWADAEQLCRSLLRVQPDHFGGLYLAGLIAAQTRRPGEAAQLLGRAVAINANDPTVHSNYGNALRELGRSSEALESYERALRLNPDFAEAHFNRGNVLSDLKRVPEALASYDRALALRPQLAEAHTNRGNALQDLRRFEEALLSYERALAIRPDLVQAHTNRGTALHELKRFDAALLSHASALRLDPDNPEAHANLGVTLQALRRHDEALASYARALALKPDYAAAHYNRGVVLQELKQYPQALQSYARALQLKPDYAEAHYNRGNALKDLQRYDEALESYDQALRIRPDHAETYTNRGNALADLKRADEALASYDRALHFKPDHPWLYGYWLHTRMHLCDWGDLDRRVTDLIAKIEHGEEATQPFPVLALCDSPALQRRAAEIWVASTCAPSQALPALGKRSARPRIRVGYYSADFHDHATAYLAAQLFEKHDRARFEVVGFSFGPDSQQVMRHRLASAFDQFLDVRARSHQEIAQLSRELQIDIAVDLKGFTQGQRMEIFSHRAAPLQVSYLGYPGTTAAPYIDYLVADATLIPAEQLRHYSEKVVYLPHSYQPNDRSRQIADREFSRAELGLPQAGFVFCCFNSAYKIMPEVFDAWMRLLRQVDGSVLWLLQDSDTAATRLRTRAQAQGVAPARLVFAARMPLPEHLARHRAADLFLDTLPCNAHTTASDALWAGLPVLTRAGDSLASRVAASLLNAVGLPELVTATQKQYEGTALQLARDAPRLTELRERLRSNRLTAPLFDSDSSTRHLEAAYVQMYERYLADLPPEHIRVSP